MARFNWHTRLASPHRSPSDIHLVPEVCPPSDYTHTLTLQQEKLMLLSPVKCCEKHTVWFITWRKSNLFQALLWQSQAGLEPNTLVPLLTICSAKHKNIIAFRKWLFLVSGASNQERHSHINMCTFSWFQLQTATMPYTDVDSNTSFNVNKPHGWALSHQLGTTESYGGTGERDIVEVSIYLNNISLVY